MPGYASAKDELDGLGKKMKDALSYMSAHTSDLAQEGGGIRIDGDPGGMAEHVAQKQRERDAYAESGKADPDRLLQMDKQLAKWQKAVDEARKREAYPLSGAPSVSDMPRTQGITEAAARQMAIDAAKGDDSEESNTAKDPEDYNWFEYYLVTTANMNNRPFVDVSAQEASDGLEQMLLGNYTDKVNMLGTMGQLLIGATPLDVVTDARDTAYDLTHMDSIPLYQLPLDVIGLLPFIGGVSDLGKTADHVIDTVDALGDVAKHSDEYVGAAQAVGRTADAVDDISDVARHSDDIADAVDAMYNGAKRFADIELKPAELMDELAESGVNYTADNVVMVTKNSDGKLLWLETGSDSAGLKHLWQRHGKQFTTGGYTQDEAPALIKTVTSAEPVRRGMKEAGPYAVYYYQDAYYLLAYGDNGFIVSFYPCG